MKPERGSRAGGPTFEIERREASSARVPAPPPGRAIAFTRYAKEQSVVLNPRDFERLAAIDAALGQTDRIAPSDLAMRAHALEETLATPVEDPERIKSILSL
jgi:hypothetical protein